MLLTSGLKYLDKVNTYFSSKPFKLTLI